MATGAAGDAFRMFEGCIPAGDLGINRRPYHKNCKCALHGSRAAQCARHSKYNNVSYPIRRSWSDGCLALMQNAPPCSPSSEIPRSNSKLVLCREEDEEEQEENENESDTTPKMSSVDSPKVKFEV